MPLPILLYHEISLVDRYCMDPIKFAQQIHYLAGQGYRTLVTSDLANNMLLNVNRVMITFDDGFETDSSQVFPILNKHGFKGIHFITTGFIGEPRYLSWEQIKLLHSQGFDIQSHTHTHSLLATISLEKIKEELSKSKDILEQKLGKKIIALSLPGGNFNQKIISVAEDCGYKYVFTTQPEINRNNSRLLHRFLVKQDSVLEDFKKAITGDYKFYQQKMFAYKIRKFMKNILGQNFYLKVWRKFYKENI